VNTPSRIDRFRTAVRRLQLNTGLGVLALVLGDWVALPLVERTAPRIAAAPAVVSQLLLGGLAWGTWCLGALPLLAFGATRLLGLAPWQTGITGAGSGFLVHLVLQYVNAGVEGLSGTAVVGQLLFAVLGAWATAAAVTAGNREREAADAKARADAQARAPELAKALGAEAPAPVSTITGDAGQPPGSSP
jgi:hypothetical protein